METINTVQLSDPDKYPDEVVIREAIGESYETYSRLLELFSELGLTLEWRYYKDGKAWLCKVQKKKKTIVWISAWPEFMQAAVYFPVRLESEILNLDLSPELKEQYQNTKNVGKTRPVIFEARVGAELEDLKTVLDYKILQK